MKKLKVLLVTTFAIASISVVNAQEQRYELKSAIIKMDMVTQGIKMSAVQYFDDYGKKEAGLGEADMAGTKVQVKSLQFGDTVYSINLAQKVGQKVVLPDPPVNYTALTPEIIDKYKIKEAGEETIVGKPCKKYTLQMEQMGQIINCEVSVWKGITLRSVTKLGMIEYQNQVAIEIQENVEVEPSIFEIPEGVVIM